jgi:hypothetical protein
MNFKIKPLVWENGTTTTPLADYYIYKAPRIFVACGYYQPGILGWQGPLRRTESKAQADAEKHHRADVVELVDDLIEVTP